MTEQQAKEIQALVHDFIKQAEITRQEKEEAEGECTFELAAIYNIFIKVAEFEYRLRKLENGQKRADDFLDMNTPLGG